MGLGLQNKSKGPQREHSKYLVPGFSLTVLHIKILLNQLLIIFKWLISSTHDLGPLPISNLVLQVLINNPGWTLLKIANASWAAYMFFGIQSLE